MDTKKKLEVISGLIDRKIIELNMEIETLKESIYDESDIFNISLLNNLYDELKEFNYYSKLINNYQIIFKKDDIEYAEKHLYLDLITNIRIVELINRTRIGLDKKRFEEKINNEDFVDEYYKIHTQMSFDINKGKRK